MRPLDSAGRPWTAARWLLVGSALKRATLEVDDRSVEQGEQVGAAAVGRPMPADIPKALPHMTSRWHAGVSTFGPKGRMISTGITLIIPAWFLFLTLVVGPLVLAIGVPVMVAWCGWVAPWILRDTWARDAFYVPEPPIPPSQQMMTWDGHRIPTLEEYVATQLGAGESS